MSYADGYCIFITIKPYIDYYKTIYDFPLMKYMINPNYKLSWSLEDVKPLHTCYTHYKTKFENLDATIKIDKNTQTQYLAEFIKNRCILEDKIIHETCCGFSVLGETLLDYSKNTHLIGYDINSELLAKNTKHFDKKLAISKLEDKNTVKCKSNRASFKMLNFLDESITVQNTGNEIITCLHGCGQLHRNIISSMIEQQYNGAFFIIPCCYHKFLTTEKYKLYNYDCLLSAKMLKTIALSSNNEATSKYKNKYTKQLLMNIKANLLIKYLIANNLIPFASIPDTTQIDYFARHIKEHGYFTLKKIPYNDTDDEPNWNKILKIIFGCDIIIYSMYENIIQEQHTHALQILDKILFENHNILLQLSKLHRLKRKMRIISYSFLSM